MEIFGAPSQMAIGMNVMLAMTWSSPSETNAETGSQIPMTLDVTSRPCRPKKHPRQTSQLQPIPRRKIMWNSGVTCFFSANEITAFLKGGKEKLSLSGSRVSLAYASERKKKKKKNQILTAKNDSNNKKRSGHIPQKSNDPMY